MPEMTDREMVTAIAAKVMGWKIKTTSHEGNIYAWAAPINGEIKYLSTAYVPCWNPLGSIADAWEVVEAMRKRFRRVEVHLLNECNGGGAVCLIEGGTSEVDEHYIADAEADSAPRAICLAALATLKAVESVGGGE